MSTDTKARETGRVIALPVRAVNTGRIRIEDANGNIVARVDYSECDYNENRMIRFTLGVARAEEIVRVLNAYDSLTSQNAALVRAINDAIQQLDDDQNYAGLLADLSAALAVARGAP